MATFDSPIQKSLSLFFANLVTTKVAKNGQPTTLWQCFYSLSARSKTTRAAPTEVRAARCMWQSFGAINGVFRTDL
ncbi:MAG: hypothetical protein J6I87_03860, partial [Rikenellaceae bacterium]|nr:hypothetical protein [Rikenellaceae bacterium]